MTMKLCALLGLHMILWRLKPDNKKWKIIIDKFKIMKQKVQM